MTILSLGRAPARLMSVAVLLLVMLVSLVGPATPVALASFTPNPYTQGFDGLASSGTGNTWTDNSTIPLWYSSRTIYLAGTGTNTTGGLYSFGSTAVPEDRALGGLGSNATGTIYFGAQLTNNTGATLSQLDVSYTGEQWRNGGNTTVQKLDFQYLIGSTSAISVGVWTDVNALDFTGPVATATATALDGNLAANRVPLSASISGLSVPPGETIWLRWADANDAGNDHGLAVDDLSVMAVGGPVLPTVTVTATDASAAEAGQDPGTFRVSRSGDTTAALTVNVTASGTATADDDYTPALASTVEIAAGAAFTDLAITPVDDIASEGDETAILTATAGAGYTVGTPAGATVTIADNEAAPVACPAGPSITKIAAIQGTGENAALLGAVTVEGVVTHISSSLLGIYIQEEAADQDADAATSEGIFVFMGNATTFNTLTTGLAVGDVARVSGTAQDRSTSGGTPSVTTLNTQIAGTLITVTDCGVTAPVTPVDVTFPLASASDFERYEGMLVRFTQPLRISEYFNFDRFGEVVLSFADGTPGLGGRARFYTPTNIVEPGAAATALSAEYAKRRITLDDGRTNQNPTPAIHPNGQPFTLANSFRGGDTMTGMVGNIDHTFGLFRVQPTDRGTYTATNPRPASPVPLTGSVRVAALNTLNFFLTLDPSASSSTGPCGGNQNLECRGANDANEFTRQRDKLIEALKGINADVQGLNELENTPGVDPLGDPTSGIVTGLNAALGAGTYSYIDTGVIGTDAIRVGIIYKPAVVTPVGPFQILDTSDDPRFLDTKNRPVLAQTFEENATGATFTVAVAHLKSKGSDCNDVGDPDAGDGQGNCNGTRTLAAQALVDWLDATFTDKDFLIVGDMNSYAKEDPIDAVLAGPDGVAGNGDDYTNLIQRFVGDDAYSYVFDGQLGYLDYALASASMNAQATGATEWHINADEPDLIDYDTSFKAANEDALYEVNAYRTSDHDPVIVGLSLTSTPVVVAPTITTQPQSQTIDAGQAATLSVVATGTEPLSYQWYAGLSGDTASPIAGATSASYTTPALTAGTYNYWARVSNSAGFADSTTATITVQVPICEQVFTPIYSIQGTGASAAITGNVTVEGVVVGDFEGANTVGINGFYLQDETGDGDAATSDGIFVFTGTAAGVNTVAAGERVRVTGFARERFNETTLNGSNSNAAAVPAANIVKCGTASIAPTTVTLPVASTTFLERYEGMLINLSQSLVISEYFNYDRFGEYVLALPIGDEPRPYTPTAVEVPGSPAYQARLDLNLRSRILIDDGLGAENPIGGNTHPNGQPYSLSNSFRGGDTVAGLTGVLGFGFSNYRVQPTAYGTYTALNPRPAAPAPVGGSLRAGAFNTLNYFLTADYPSGNPLDNKCGPLQNVECRGWDFDQTNELTRQRDKLLAALKGIDADILGLNELENTAGVEPLADIVAGLNADLGAGTYAYINTGTIGTDAIKVGLIYKPAAVTPVGPFETLTTADDPRFRDTLNRPVLAQTFEENATGAIFTVAVVHLKSKGSDCNAVSDPDAGDGQGNCNGTRTLAAQALVDWLDTTFEDPDFLIVGDMNSYARENPISAVLAGPDDVVGTSDDYTNLIQRFIGAEAYSYVFDGQSGYLDHALASASMNAQATGATEWHINADELDLIDYDTTFKSDVQDGYYAPDAYRTSDHDPVIVGLDLNAAPVALDDTFSTNEDVAVSGNVLANDTDGNDDVLTAALVGSPAGVTLAADGTFTFTPPANASGTYTFEYIVSDGSLSDTGLVTISVLAVNDLPTITALPGTALCTPGSVANGAFQVATSDVEPGALTITTSSSNPLITAVVTGSTVTFSVAGSSQAQSGTVTITVTDAGGATAAITASVWAGRGQSDSRTGGAGIDVMFGLGGGDTLRGGGGFDLLCGGAGADNLFGDDGADTLDGGAGSDKLRGGDDDDRLFGGDGADDLFGDGGADTLDGGAGADLLRGGGDSDQIFGGAGADDLFGDDGDDTLTGGADRDSFDGGAGTDTVTDRAGNESQIRVP